MARANRHYIPSETGSGIINEVNRFSKVKGVLFAWRSFVSCLQRKKILITRLF